MGSVADGENGISRHDAFLQPHPDRKLLTQIFEDVDLFESASALLMLRDAARS